MTLCIIKFVHASRERNGDFDVCVCVCMCVFYMADDVVAVLIFLRTCKSKNSNIKNDRILLTDLSKFHDAFEIKVKLCFMRKK